MSITQSLYYKPDWPKAQQRIAACWERQNTDRPALDVKAPSGRELPPLPDPSSLEAIWLDPEYLLAKWLRYFEGTYLAGESVPVGPILLAGYATGCNANVRFAENTIWHPRSMPSIDAPFGWSPGPHDPWRIKLVRVINRLLDEAPGRFLVGYTGQVPVNDLLALLRGTEDFLVDMARDLGKCVRRLEEMFPLWMENILALKEAVDARQEAGWVYGWPGLWHPKALKGTQSDMSCMISSYMFDKFVLREMDLLGERYEFIWYHLDGPLAVRHLPALLKKPYIKCIQWVPGDGQPTNGPAWLELYRRVQAAGRCLDIDMPWEHAEWAIRHLRPEGLLLRVHAPSREAADELLVNAVGWCGSYASSTC